MGKKKTDCQSLEKDEKKIRKKINEQKKYKKISVNRSDKIKKKLKLWIQ